MGDLRNPLFGFFVLAVVVYVLYETPELVRRRFRDGKRAGRDSDEK